MTPPSKLLSENSFFTDIFRPCSSFFFNFPAVDQHWMCSFLFSFTRFLTKGKTLPKAQRTWRLSSAYQSSNKFKHKSWSNFIFRISTKHQLQNLNQTSASQLILKLSLSEGLVKILKLKFYGEADVWLRFLSWCLVEILKMKFDQDLCLNLWYEFYPRVRCAFGNVLLHNRFLAYDLTEPL